MQLMYIFIRQGVLSDYYNYLLLKKTKIDKMNSNKYAKY